MSPVKFVHVMKRIESLERDISEIHSLQQDIKTDREYSIPVKISLEQQINTLLNEKVKLMEVRIENAPDYFSSEKNATTVSALSSTKIVSSFDALERLYYENLRHKRSNYNYENSINLETLKKESIEPEKLDTKGLPSLAEKSLIKPAAGLSEDEKSFIKRREDLLKNLPPLEY